MPAMRTPLKVLAMITAFGIFYAGAFAILQGAQAFENRGEAVLFTSKADAAAVANAEVQESNGPVSPTNAVWK